MVVVSQLEIGLVVHHYIQPIVWAKNRLREFEDSLLLPFFLVSSDFRFGLSFPIFDTILLKNFTDILLGNTKL